MRRPRTLLTRFAILAASVALLASCASPGYNATKLERQLTDAGLTEAQARCVTGALEDTYDQGQLGSRSEPTLRELEKTRSILTGCKVPVAKLNALTP